MITAVQLRDIAPGARAADILAYQPWLDKYMPSYHITGRLRMAAFLAQLLHESGGFRYLEEIASGKAYEGRKDIGNIHPGDGVKFKGRGPIQITGRNNYKALSLDLYKDLRLLDYPEKVATYDVGTQAACWFWNTRALNEIADKPERWSIEVRKGIFYKRFEYITYKINGALNGWSDRLQYYNRALKVFEGLPV